MKLLIILLTLLYTFSIHASEYGKYSGTVVTEWLDDGRKMKLLKDFHYIDPNGVNWNAPKDTIVDGASIPTFAWSIIGSPFSGKYRNSSVIHDVACQTRERSWKNVHLAFYYGMLASDVSKLKAKIMYAAVYHFGPRWDRQLVIRNPDYNKESTNKLNCLGPKTQQMCKGNPLSDPREEVLINIPPIEKQLSIDKFNELAELIRENEEQGTPLSLEQISSYKEQ